MDKPTIAVTISGKISGLSPWDVTLWFATNDLEVSVSDAVTNFAAAFPAAIDIFGNTWANLNDGGTTIQSCQVRGYAAGGSGAIAQATTVPHSPIVGISAVGGAASQACCATLYTARPGKSGRGRLYWPATAALGAGYQFPDTYVSNLALATRNLYQAVGAWQSGTLPSEFVGVVRSLTLGTTNAITDVACNSQPDRQEHRERHLTFTRHQTAF